MNTLNTLEPANLQEIFNRHKSFSKLFFVKMSWPPLYTVIPDFVMPVLNSFCTHTKKTLLPIFFIFTIFTVFTVLVLYKESMFMRLSGPFKGYTKRHARNKMSIPIFISSESQSRQHINKPLGQFFQTTPEYTNRVYAEIGQLFIQEYAMFISEIFD